MIDHEIQELLRRCEREAPSQEDLDSLAALLARQEAAGGWAEICASLRSGLGDERVELAEVVVAAAGPGAERGVPQAMRALAAGLAQEAPRGEVAAAVIAAAGLEPWLPPAVLGAFAEGLRAEAEGVDLADLVLTAVESEHPDLVLSALADGELAGAAREAATARISAEPEARRFVNQAALLGQVLRRGLAREVAGEDLSPIWEGVAAELGLAEELGLAKDAPLAEVLSAGIEAEAGPIDIADLVMGRIAPVFCVPEAAPEVAPEPAPAVVERPAPIRLPWYRRLPALALIGAAAALLLVLQVVGPDGQSVVPSNQPDLTAPALELAAVNDTEIEDLEVAESAMVQVFQLDDGAPMVIFIDEGFGGESPEGVTL